MAEDIQNKIEEENVVEDAGNSVTTLIGSNRTLELQQTNVVRYKNQVESTIIDIKDINRICSICENAKDNKVPWADILLGVATLFSGAFLSAIISGVVFEANWKSILFYMISPAVSVGCFVAFVFLRKQGQLSIKSIATQILELLHDSSDDWKDQGDNNES